MICKRCSSENVNVQSTVTEKKENGCIYLILLFIPVVGWITLFYLVFSKKHYYRFVCYLPKLWFQLAN